MKCEHLVALVWLAGCSLDTRPLVGDVTAQTGGPSWSPSAAPAGAHDASLGQAETEPAQTADATYDATGPMRDEDAGAVPIDTDEAEAKALDAQGRVTVDDDAADVETQHGAQAPDSENASSQALDEPTSAATGSEDSSPEPMRAAPADTGERNDLDASPQDARGNDADGPSDDDANAAPSEPGTEHGSSPGRGSSGERTREAKQSNGTSHREDRKGNGNHEDNEDNGDNRDDSRKREGDHGQGGSGDGRRGRGD